MFTQEMQDQVLKVVQLHNLVQVGLYNQLMPDLLNKQVVEDQLQEEQVFKGQILKNQHQELANKSQIYLNKPPRHLTQLVQVVQHLQKLQIKLYQPKHQVNNLNKKPNKHHLMQLPLHNQQIQSLMLLKILQKNFRQAWGVQFQLKLQAKLLVKILQHLQM